MAEYRSFVRAAAGFNGTTVDAAVYNFVGFLGTTATASAVGRFTPTSLLRVNGACSIVMPMLKGTVDPATDTFAALDAGGVIRYSEVATKVPGTWMYLGSQDILAITSAGATGVDIVVNDLDDAQLQAWILSDITASAIAAASSTSGFYLPPIVSAVDPVVLPASISGKIQVIQTTGAAAQTVTLPLSSAVAVGTEVDMYNVSVNAHELAPTGADLINNVNGPFAVATTERVIVKSFGPVIGWVVVLSA